MIYILLILVFLIFKVDELVPANVSINLDWFLAQRLIPIIIHYFLVFLGQNNQHATNFHYHIYKQFRIPSIAIIEMYGVGWIFFFHCKFSCSESSK